MSIDRKIALSIDRKIGTYKSTSLEKRIDQG